MPRALCDDGRWSEDLHYGGIGLELDGVVLLDLTALIMH
jgi:hypothetical protein